MIKNLKRLNNTVATKPVRKATCEMALVAKVTDAHIRDLVFQQWICLPWHFWSGTGPVQSSAVNSPLSLANMASVEISHTAAPVSCSRQPGTAN